MNRIGQLLFAGFFAASLTGCVIAVNDDFDDDSRWRKQEKRNKEGIGKLSIGQDLNSVIRTMGEPDISEAYQESGKEFRIYYYRTHEVHTDNRTTKDESTPLVFVDGSLIGWGEMALQQAER